MGLLLTGVGDKVWLYCIFLLYQFLRFHRASYPFDVFTPISFACNKSHLMLSISFENYQKEDNKLFPLLFIVKYKFLDIDCIILMVSIWLYWTYRNHLVLYMANVEYPHFFGNFPSWLMWFEKVV